MKSSYRHLFFDLDHTLWDHHGNSRSTLSLLFDKHRLQEKMAAEFTRFWDSYVEINDNLWSEYRQGKITKEKLRVERFHRSFSSLGYDDVKFCQSFEAEYMNTCPRQTGLMPGVKEILNYLVEHYELHIITNGFAETQDIKLEHSGLKPYFGKVIASDEVGITKPQAGIFVESMKRVGATRRESLMIGDSLVADIVGARNCGIDQVYYNPEKRSHQEAVTYEIESLRELETFL